MQVGAERSRPRYALSEKKLDATRADRDGQVAEILKPSLLVQRAGASLPEVGRFAVSFGVQAGLGARSTAPEGTGLRSLLLRQLCRPEVLQPADRSGLVKDHEVTLGVPKAGAVAAEGLAAPFAVNVHQDIEGFGYVPEAHRLRLHRAQRTLKYAGCDSARKGQAARDAEVRAPTGQTPGRWGAR